MKTILSHTTFDLDQNDYIQQTPLHWAASRGHKSCADLLIRYGASVNHSDNNGQTPIFYAASGGFTDMCKLLVNRGADFQHSDRRRETPFHYARRNKHREVLEYLTQLKNNLKNKQR